MGFFCYRNCSSKACCICWKYGLEYDDFVVCQCWTWKDMLNCVYYSGSGHEDTVLCVVVLLKNHVDIC